MAENKHIDLTLEELEQISNKDEELYIKSENTLLAYHKDFKDYDYCSGGYRDGCYFCFGYFIVVIVSGGNRFFI